MAERELLFSLTKKDFRVDTFRAGGKGGQKQNKTSSGVRITHIESGAIGESREERSQHVNKERALRRCIESATFQSWHKRKTAELLVGKSELERRVESEMASSKIKSEYYDGKNWVEEVE
nr:peptide chain release factor-like protein [Oceanobacillus sojae]